MIMTVYSMAEAAAHCGITKGAFRRLYQEGRISGNKMGPRKIEFDLDECLRTVQELKEAGHKFRSPADEPAQEEEQKSELDLKVEEIQNASLLTGMRSAAEYLVEKAEVAKRTGFTALAARLYAAYAEAMTELAAQEEQIRAQDDCCAPVHTTGPSMDSPTALGFQ
jgi:hypothetical protein